MNLAKVGGIYWATSDVNLKKSNCTSQLISPVEKTDSISDFKTDVRILKASNSIEKMMNVKRTKQRRQFIDEIAK